MMIQLSRTMHGMLKVNGREEILTCKEKENRFQLRTTQVVRREYKRDRSTVDRDIKPAYSQSRATVDSAIDPNNPIQNLAGLVRRPERLKVKNK